MKLAHDLMMCFFYTIYLTMSFLFLFQNDFESQAVLINCLLRNYLHYNLYDQVRFV